MTDIEVRSRRERIWHNGIAYDRYPDAEQSYLRDYFRSNPSRGDKSLHRVIWEEYYGKIPKGYVVAFKDGDPANLDIANLHAVSRSVNARLHAPFGPKGVRL